MISSHVKITCYSRVRITCFRAKAHTVFHCCLYNNFIYLFIYLLYLLLYLLPNIFRFNIKSLLECPVLPQSIPHGYVNGTGSVQGSVYSFRCRSGYSLVGGQDLYCTGEGTWNTSIPTCLKGTKRFRIPFNLEIH